MRVWYACRALLQMPHGTRLNFARRVFLRPPHSRLERAWCPTYYTLLSSSFHFSDSQCALLAYLSRMFGMHRSVALAVVIWDVLVGVGCILFIERTDLNVERAMIHSSLLGLDTLNLTASAYWIRFIRVLCFGSQSWSKLRLALLSPLAIRNSVRTFDIYHGLRHHLSPEAVKCLHPRLRRAFGLQL